MIVCGCIWVGISFHAVFETFLSTVCWGSLETATFRFGDGDSYKKMNISHIVSKKWYQSLRMHNKVEHNYETVSKYAFLISAVG